MRSVAPGQGGLVSVCVMGTYSTDTFQSPADSQSGVTLANANSSAMISVTTQAFDQNDNPAGSATIMLAPGVKRRTDLWCGMQVRSKHRPPKRCSTFAISASNRLVGVGAE
jgi:hypothetical protein